MRYDLTVTYIGFVECEKCSTITYINKPKEVKIWHHPDDDMPITQVKCKKCGMLVEQRITWDHVSNFRKRGCKILPLSNRYPRITEEAICDFEENFDAKYERFFIIK
jgi:hypothetical protein